MTSPANTIKRFAPFIIFFLALGVVGYRFMEVPRNTTFDEIEFAKLAINLGTIPYTPYSFLATGHATLYFYLLLLSFKLFGVSLLALRIPAAVFGVLNPILFYAVFKRAFPKNAVLPLLLTLLFATTRWYFNFARFGFEATFLLFLELLSLYGMVRFISREEADKNAKGTGSWKWLVLSGIAAGLAYNSYQPGRIFAVIPLALFAFHNVRSFSLPSIKQVLRLLLPFFIPFFILILPLTIYLSIHKDTRFYQQFYPDNHEMTLEEKGEFFVRNLKSTAGIFNVRGDVNGRHNYPNKPALNPITGALFITGLIFCVLDLKNKYSTVFFMWFLISLAPTLVTYPWENPNMLRTFTAIPGVIYFIGIVASKLLAFAGSKKRKALTLAAIAVLFAASGIYELRTYFVHQAAVFEEAFEAGGDLQTYLKWDK